MKKVGKHLKDSGGDRCENETKRIHNTLNKERQVGCKIDVGTEGHINKICSELQGINKW